MARYGPAPLTVGCSARSTTAPAGSWSNRSGSGLSAATGLAAGTTRRASTRSARTPAGRPAGVLVAVSCGGVWSTVDDGASWALRTQDPQADYVRPEQAEQADSAATQDPHRVERCPGTPEVMRCPHHSGIWRSTGGAQQWQRSTATAWRWPTTAARCVDGQHHRWPVGQRRRRPPLGHRVDAAAADLRGALRLIVGVGCFRPGGPGRSA